MSYDSQPVHFWQPVHHAHCTCCSGTCKKGAHVPVLTSSMLTPPTNSPAGPVWLPGSKTDPAELCFAGTAVHVVAATILLNGSMTLWTLLSEIQQQVPLLLHIISLSFSPPPFSSPPPSSSPPPLPLYCNESSLRFHCHHHTFLTIASDTTWVCGMCEGVRRSV